MATATRTRPPAPANLDGLRPYRLTVRQFETMIGAGVFPDEVRAELLGGVLAEKMTRNAPHDYTVRRLANLLRGLSTPDLVVSEEKAVVLGRDWRPEPDVAVALRPEDRYRATQPRARDLRLLIEVAESTDAADRGVKWRGYASARVPVYWIVNLEKRVVEVYSRPTGRGGAARYAEAAVFDAGAHVPIVVDGEVRGALAVRDLLP